MKRNGPDGKMGLSVTQEVKTIYIYVDVIGCGSCSGGKLLQNTVIPWTLTLRLATAPLKILHNLTPLLNVTEVKSNGTFENSLYKALSVHQ